MNSFILLSENVVLPNSIDAAAVFVEDGKISFLTNLKEYKNYKKILKNFQIIDLGKKFLFPGIVDTHVHVNEPGRTSWEGFETATKAACSAGISLIVDMPLYSIPVTTSLSALNIKKEYAKNHSFVDYSFFGGIIPGNLDELDSMIDNGVCGFKAFMCHSGIDDFPMSDEDTLYNAMLVLAKRNIPLLVHAELCPSDYDDINSKNITSNRYIDYLESRPKSFEDNAIKKIIELCRKTMCHVHIVHLSSSSALDFIAKAKLEGLPLSVETCPHYLFFSAEEIPDGATYFKCAPPIRESSNREKLWNGLKSGIIDFIACDHSPCTPDLKLLETGDFLNAWGGISSLQFSPSVIFTEARSRRDISMTQLSDWLSRKPSILAGLSNKKGQINIGFDADLAVWDFGSSYKVSIENIFHKNKITPYMNKELHGVLEKFWIRGNLVFDKKLLSNTCIGSYTARS